MAILARVVNTVLSELPYKMSQPCAKRIESRHEINSERPDHSSSLCSYMFEFQSRFNGEILKSFKQENEMIQFTF